MHASRPRSLAAALLVAALFVPLAVSSPAAGAAPGVPAAPSADPRPSAEALEARPLTPAGRVQGSKARTSDLAQTDPDVVGRTDSAVIPVLVKFDYDSISTYPGGAGAPATSPATTGQDLTAATATTSAYARSVRMREGKILSAIGRAVPEARVGRRLRVVYGGVSLTLPANRAKALLDVAGVVAVQADQPRQLLTDSSNEFLGAPPVWEQQGGQALAGSGVLFGSLDSGAWPEHPSFADNPDLGPAPTRPGGSAIPCDFGDNPLTVPVDVFECNSKLVGGQPFLDTYNQVITDPPEVFADSARDSDGHGSHTASTAAGGVVESAEIFGVERGPISGVAPGAWVSVYKVCGSEGCFGSDSAAAVEAAILDGVDVINFSISGGSDPLTDPVELAFLDAYAAGVFVAASAGNSGPDPSTADHLSPWVTTVAASTQTREFRAAVELTSTDGATASLAGVSIGTGLATPHPVVKADNVPGYADVGCLEEPPAADTFDGLIVACERGPGRVARGFNVASGGGEGMILYNPTLADTETDNHWLPVVHLADGADLLAFLDAHPGVTATFTPGTATDGQGDVMASFSSRGPAGSFVKPDVTAPGVQILGAHTPSPDQVALGPPGEYFQAIAGTSMSSPQVAGAALLLAASHPDWTPGQWKSALMTTATTEVVKEDLATPADPFDMGSGRIRVDASVNPGLTISESAQGYAELTPDPRTTLDINVPSLNAPVMPGRITTTRRVTNVSGGTAVYTVSTQAPDGTSISVSPARFTVAAGATRTLTVTIEADPGVQGQQFGRIDLAAAGRAPLHLPVAFVPRQGGVALTSDCAADDIEVGATTACSVTATNEGFADTTIDLQVSGTDALGLTGPGQTNGVAAASVPLAGREPGVPSLAEYGPLGDGYLPLDGFGVEPEALGDEDAIDFETAPFLYNGVVHDSFSVVSNGYLVVGGPATSPDIQCCPPQQLPDVAPPNNVLAPFWADLTGEGTDLPAPAGVFVGELADNDTGQSWTVVEFRLNAYGTDDLKVFQVWLGHNGVQDITFNYDTDHHNLDGVLLTADDGGLTVGAENEGGTGGDQLDETAEQDTLPPVDLAVVSTDPEPGDSFTLPVTAVGELVGTGVLHAELTSPQVAGVTIAETEVQVLAATTEVSAFVARAYHDFLGRDPTEQELAEGTEQVTSGELSRYQFVLSLASGDEWLGSIVDRHYDTILDRAPEASGRDFWIQRLRDGMAEADLVGRLIGSGEFLAKAGGTTDGFVERAYQVVFGRGPDAAGAEFWAQRVATGTPRSTVGFTLYQSAESRRNRVIGLYETLLQRPPDAGGLAYWAGQLATKSDLALASNLAASDEYFRRVP